MSGEKKLMTAEDAEDFRRAHGEELLTEKDAKKSWALVEIPIGGCEGIREQGVLRLCSACASLRPG